MSPDTARVLNRREFFEEVVTSKFKNSDVNAQKFGSRQYKKAQVMLTLMDYTCLGRLFALSHTGPKNEAKSGD